MEAAAVAGLLREDLDPGLLGGVPGLGRDGVEVGLGSGRLEAAGVRDGAVFKDDLDGDLLVALAGLRGELVAEDAGVELRHQAALLLLALGDVGPLLLALDVELRNDFVRVGVGRTRGGVPG